MCSESVNDLLAATCGEVNFDTKTEALLRNKDGGIVILFFQNTEGSIVAVFVEGLAFGEPILVESVLDLAWGTKIGCQDRDNTDDNKGKEGPPLQYGR